MAEPSLQEDYDTIGKWLLHPANQGKAGTPEYTEMANAYKEIGRRLTTAPPADAGAPPTDPVALRQWADKQEASEAANAGIKRKINDYIRSAGQGSALGSFADEANAAIYSRLPEWLGGKGYSYDQELALQHARNRRVAGENPVLDPVLGVGGAVMEQAAIGPLARAYQAARVPGRVAIDTTVGAIHGFGSGEGDVRARAEQAAKEGAMSGVTSSVLNKVLGAYGKYSTRSPEVDQAATTLGQPRQPFFVAAADPKVQAAGRQMAQENPAGGVGQAWTGAREGVTQGGGDIVQGITGAPVQVAPNVAGMQVRSGMQEAGRNATAEIARIADETTSRMPANFLGDPAATRTAAQDLINARQAAGHTNPAQGLDQVTNLTTQPGGVTWPGFQRFVRETGQTLGEHPAVPRQIPNADLEPIYAAARGTDQPSWVRQALGPQAEERFVQGVEEQSQLAGMRQAIADAVDRAQPEQLINTIYNAATTKGGGTRLDQLGLIWRSLSPQQQQQAAAGILAKIQNDAAAQGGGVIPSKVAVLLNSLPEQTRNLLFPPGTQLGQQVDALRTLAGRVGAVDQMQHVGSAKTLGERMLGTGLGVTGTTGAAGGIAHLLGLPIPEVMAASLAAQGARGAYRRLAKPYLLQHGMPQMSPGVRALSENIVGGASRAPWLNK